MQTDGHILLNIFNRRDVKSSYFDCAPSPTTRCPSVPIMLPESSQIMNLTGVAANPAKSAFLRPVGHPRPQRNFLTASLLRDLESPAGGGGGGGGGPLPG